jgi:hypothetical protein
MPKGILIVKLQLDYQNVLKAKQVDLKTSNLPEDTKETVAGLLE